METDTANAMLPTPAKRDPRLDNAKSENAAVASLRERLRNGALTAQDEERLALTKKILALRAQKLSFSACARELGLSESMVHKFATRGVFKLLKEYLATEAQAQAGEKADVVVRKARSEFAEFAPDAIDFYRYAFLRNPEEAQEEKGLWRDESLAQWATEKVSKGIGLTEPEHATRPTVVINVGSIHAEMRSVDEDDKSAKSAVIDAEIIEDEAS